MGCGNSDANDPNLKSSRIYRRRSTHHDCHHPDLEKPQLDNDDSDEDEGVFGFDQDRNYDQVNTKYKGE
jgi:hypothetical protein